MSKTRIAQLSHISCIKITYSTRSHFSAECMYIANDTQYIVAHRFSLVALVLMIILTTWVASVVTSNNSSDIQANTGSIQRWDNLCMSSNSTNNYLQSTLSIVTIFSSIFMVSVATLVINDNIAGAGDTHYLINDTNSGIWLIPVNSYYVMLKQKVASYAAQLEFKIIILSTTILGDIITNKTCYCDMIDSNDDINDTKYIIKTQRRFIPIQTEFDTTYSTIRIFIYFAILPTISVFVQQYDKAVLTFYFYFCVMFVCNVNVACSMLCCFFICVISLLIFLNSALFVLLAPSSNGYLERNNIRLMELVHLLGKH